MKASPRSLMLSSLLVVCSGAYGLSLIGQNQFVEANFHDVKALRVLIESTDRFEDWFITKQEIEDVVETRLKTDGVPYTTAAPKPEEFVAYPNLYVSVNAVKADDGTAAVSLDTNIFSYGHLANNDASFVSQQLWKAKGALMIGPPAGCKDALKKDIVAQIDSFATIWLKLHPRSAQPGL